MPDRPRLYLIDGYALIYRAFHALGGGAPLRNARGENTGMAKGVIQQVGQQGNFRYFINGKPLDLNNTKEVVEMVRAGTFGGGSVDPMVTMQAAMNLSQSRAEAVKKSLEQYAQESKINVDLSQIVPVGAGILEPIIPMPRNMEEAKENMRVEFRIVKVNPEALAPTDFNF